MTSALNAAIVDLATLNSERAAWTALAAAALEPNPFYGPDFLLATQAQLHPRRKIRCLIVRGGAEHTRLDGLFPLERPHGRDGLLWGALSLYRNPYVCLTTPLIRAENAAATLASALAYLAGSAKRLLIPMVPDHRAFSHLLHAHADTHHLALYRVDGRTRPAVETHRDAEAYRAQLWKKGTRSTERRRLKQLEALGSVTYRRISSTEAGARVALEAFLALEAKGWKGRNGTALSSRETTRAFAEAALLPDPDRGEVIFEFLLLDERPLAATINLVAGGVGYALKSAYDEEFAAFGVGTLLDGLSLDLATAGGPLARLDSCTAMSHPIRQRWRQEEPIGRYLLGLKPETRIGVFARWTGLFGPLGVWRGYESTEV